METVDQVEDERIRIQDRLNDPITISIGIGPAIRTRTANGRANVMRRVSVHAYATCNESLYVHPAYARAITPDPDWTLTHGPTGMMVATGLPDARTAMYVAGALNRLWWWAHPEGDSSKVPAHQREFKRLPDALRDWLLSWGYRD
jgi:hypothetical protein